MVFIVEVGRLDDMLMQARGVVDELTNHLCKLPKKFFKKKFRKIE